MNSPKRLAGIADLLYLGVANFGLVRLGVVADLIQVRSGSLSR